MKTSYKLPFKIFGIPVKLHVSFLLFFPVLAWIIGNNLQFYINVLQLDVNTAALTTQMSPILIGLIAAAGLFICVTLHELGHSFVARKYGIKIKGITLHVLGGVAQLEDVSTGPGSEAKMAITGPLVSFGLGGLAWVALMLIGPQAALPKFIAGYMVYMNFAVGVFNLLPAIPLDGGRVLRSLLSLKQSRIKATRISTQISKAISVAMGIYGLFNFQLFLIAIAVFIFFAANSEAKQLFLHKTLQSLKIEELMSKDVKTVKPDTEVDQLIHTMIENSHLGYPVVDDDGEVLGIVTLEDLQRHSSEGSERVEDIMTSEITSIHLSQGAGDAFNKMTNSDLGRLVVVDDEGQLVGIITRSDIFNALKVTGAIPEREEGPLAEGEGGSVSPAGGLFGKSGT